MCQPSCCVLHCSVFSSVGAGDSGWLGCCWLWLCWNCFFMRLQVGCHYTLAGDNSSCPLQCAFLVSCAAMLSNSSCWNCCMSWNVICLGCQVMRCRERAPVGNWKAGVLAERKCENRSVLLGLDLGCMVLICCSVVFNCFGLQQSAGDMLGVWTAVLL